MKRPIVPFLLVGTALLMIATAAVGAEPIAGDPATLRAAGAAPAGMTAIEAPVEEPTPPADPLVPDDARLVDLVRLIKSGLSESIVAEQMRQSGQAYNLSVNDLLYLKQNGVLESTIETLMSTRGGVRAAPGAAGAAPVDLTFDDLVQVRSSFMKKDRSGRLVLRGNSLAWMDGGDPKNNFEFQITGLKKVWFTCQARTPENFCYQINFEIVKGAQYRFRDVNRESGSNASVLKVMEALRLYFPQVVFGAPDA